MEVQKEDLGLSLSINFQENPLQLRPSLASTLPSTSPSKLFQKAYLPQAMLSSETCRVVEPKPFMKGIDVNRLPSMADGEEELSGKRSERDSTNNGEEIETGRASSRGMSDQEDGENPRKKLRLSKDQSAVLEETFKEHKTLNPKQKLALARRLGLGLRQVEVWFQNRRSRTKLKQTEADCRYLKRYCESLTAENMRLQKEVQELRALKLSPQLCMHMTPPKTITMCTSCEHVAVPPPSMAATPSPAPSTPETPGGPRGHQMGPQSMLFKPWASTPVPHRPFDTLLTRS